MRNSQKKTPQEGATVKHAAHGIGVITYIKGSYMGVSFKSAGD